MSLLADRQLIAEEVKRQRSRGLTSITLRVEMASEDRISAFEHVRDALGEAPTYVHEASGTTLSLWRLYPAEGGPLMWIGDADAWDVYVSELEERLSATEPPCRVTAVPAPRDSGVIPENTLAPSAMMGFQIEPRYEMGPLNVWGQPTHRWGVPEHLSERLIERAVRWATSAGEIGIVSGGGSLLPATPRDATDLVLQLRSEVPRRVTCTFQAAAQNGSIPVRFVTFDSFGQVTYTEWNPDVPYTALAEALIPILEGHADDAEIGVIYLHRSSDPTWTSWRDGSRWLKHRHLWASHVYDAAGIQLVTDEHLSHANDLSDWRVIDVSRRKKLIQAREPDDWYAAPDIESWKRHQFPTTQTVRDARSNFGSMILDAEIATRNPPRFN